MLLHWSSKKKTGYWPGARFLLYFFSLRYLWCITASNYLRPRKCSGWFPYGALFYEGIVLAVLAMYRASNRKPLPHTGVPVVSCFSTPEALGFLFEKRFPHHFSYKYYRH